MVVRDCKMQRVPKPQCGFKALQVASAKIEIVSVGQYKNKRARDVHFELGIKIDGCFRLDNSHTNVACENVGEFNAGPLADRKFSGVLLLEKLFDTVAGCLLAEKRGEEAGIEVEHYPSSSRISRMSRWLGLRQGGIQIGKIIRHCCWLPPCGKAGRGSWYRSRALSFLISHLADEQVARLAPGRHSGSKC